VERRRGVHPQTTLRRRWFSVTDAAVWNNAALVVFMSFGALNSCHPRERERVSQPSAPGTVLPMMPITLLPIGTPARFMIGHAWAN
jgi:hypothetical protein